MMNRLLLLLVALLLSACSTLPGPGTGTAGTSVAPPTALSVHLTAAPVTGTPGAYDLVATVTGTPYKVVFGADTINVATLTAPPYAVRVPSIGTGPHLLRATACSDATTCVTDTVQVDGATPAPSPTPPPVSSNGSLSASAAMLNSAGSVTLTFTPPAGATYDHVVLSLSSAEAPFSFDTVQSFPGSRFATTLAFPDNSQDGLRMYRAFPVDASGTFVPQPSSEPWTVLLTIALPGDCPQATPLRTSCTPDGVRPQEAALLMALNEVRTKGTLDGSTSALSGTCAVSAPRVPAVSFEGHVAYAARQHAEYLALVNKSIKVLPDHEPRESGYGVTSLDRLIRAGWRDHLGGVGAGQVGAGMTTSGLYESAASVLSRLLGDTTICPQLLDPSGVNLGVGVASFASGTTYAWDVRLVEAP